MRVLIIGCGYVGLPLGTELVRRGHQVAGLRRSLDGGETLVAAGLEPLAADVTRPDSLARLSRDWDVVVNTVSSTRGGVETYREVYLAGTRNLIQWLSGTPLVRYVHTSSTSVYGQVDGSVVTEESPAAPASETSRVLVETEQELLAAARERAFPAVIVRVAGIYGPGRGHLFHQFLRGEARITDDGSRLINMIHLEDVVTAMGAAVERGRVGTVYNVVDDETVGEAEYFSWLAGRLNRPLPPSQPASEIAGRKRGLTHKRVSNRRLREELGWRPRYPTYREGYAAEIVRLGLDSGAANE